MDARRAARLESILDVLCSFEAKLDNCSVSEDPDRTDELEDDDEPRGTSADDCVRVPGVDIRSEKPLSLIFISGLLQAKLRPCFPLEPYSESFVRAPRDTDLREQSV